MPLRERLTEKKKMQLISLMDVVFILLIFFLVSIFFASLPNEERKLPVPTPKNKPGYAQVLIQLIDDEKFFYVDPFTTEDLVKKITEIDRKTYLSPRQRLQEKKKLLLKTATYKYEAALGGANLLYRKLSLLINYANEHPEEKYFVMVRCPDDLEYGRIIEIINLLSKTKYKNIQYGLVGGTIDDIKNCKSIEKKIVSDALGRRKNVVITF